jgi:RNA polymerase sigma-70 factor (ECF subfamily)
MQSFDTATNATHQIKATHDFNDQLIALLPRLRAYAVMLSRNRVLADDIVQDAVMRALQAQHQFQPGTNFSAWMHRIVRNCFINEMRVTKRTPVSSEDLSGELYASNTDADDLILLRQLSDAMVTLPQAQQEAIILVCAGGLSYDEAAEVQGCAIGTLKSRLFRARSFLAGVVGEPITVKTLPQHDATDGADTDVADTNVVDEKQSTLDLDTPERIHNPLPESLRQAATGLPK